MKMLDFICPQCKIILYDELVKNSEMPLCEVCGMEMRIYWGGGQAPGVIGQGDYIPEAIRKWRRGQLEDAGIRKKEKPKKVPNK